MDTRDLHDKGLKLRREMFGRDAVEQRMTAFGAFGEPLQNMINAYAYGDIWSRPALPLKTKSLAAIAMTAAIGRANELRVHVDGALANGCTADEIRDILLLVALYCGIPAAIEGHRIALDVLTAGRWISSTTPSPTPSSRRGKARRCVSSRAVARAGCFWSRRRRLA